MLHKNPSRRRGNLSSLPNIEVNQQLDIDQINIQGALGGRRFGIFSMQSDDIGKLRDMVDSPKGFEKKKSIPF